MTHGSALPCNRGSVIDVALLFNSLSVVRRAAPMLLATPPSRQTRSTPIRFSYIMQGWNSDLPPLKCALVDLSDASMM